MSVHGLSAPVAETHSCSLALARTGTRRVVSGAAPRRVNSARRGGKIPCLGRPRRYSRNFTAFRVAGVAQSAEHRFCKPTVVSSTLTASSDRQGVDRGREQSEDDRAIATVPRALVRLGWIPKRPKGPDCKSGGTAFAGSNPAPPIRRGHERAAFAYKHMADAVPACGKGPHAVPQKGRFRGCNSMVEYLPSKQATWVRFPSPALGRGVGRSNAPRPGKEGRLPGPSRRRTEAPESHCCRGSVGRARPW